MNRCATDDGPNYRHASATDHQRKRLRQSRKLGELAAQQGPDERHGKRHEAAAPRSATESPRDAATDHGYQQIQQKFPSRHWQSYPCENGTPLTLAKMTLAKKGDNSPGRTTDRRRANGPWHVKESTTGSRSRQQCLSPLQRRLLLPGGI